MAGTAPEASVARVFAADGRTAGAGFLVQENLLITCAHVARNARVSAGEEVTVHFPHTGHVARSTGILLAEGWRDPEKQDLAFIRLDNTPPGTGAMRLGSSADGRGHRIWSYGFPAQAPSEGHFGYGQAGHLLPVDGMPGGLLQLSDSNDLATGFSGSPVVDETTGLVIGMVTAIGPPDDHLKGLGIAYATPVQAIREAWPGLVDREVCPYLGLDTFTADQAGWFHGRTAAVDQVLEALAGPQRAVLLLGPSGSGKSSLVQAGVLPALAEGRLPGSDRWLPVLVRPGDDLLAELERSGLPRATEGLGAAVAARLDADPLYDQLLLVVDPFEELLREGPGDTGGEPPHACRTALDQLEALAASDVPARMILIMRDDFYPRLAVAPGLRAAVKPGLVDVPATLGVQELRDIITLPAEAVGLRFADGLPQRIVTDVLNAEPARAGAGAQRARSTMLPALELALSELWRRRTDGRLTHDAYQRLGSISGSLATWCNTALHQMAPAQQPIAQRLLTALVRPADEARRIPAVRQQLPLSTLRDIAADAGGGPEVGEVLDALIHTRIIITRNLSDGPRTPVAELIHEALIRDWGELREWVRQDHRFQDWLRRAEEQRARWTAHQRSPEELLSGSVLSEGLEHAAARRLPRETAAFLRASRDHQQARHRRLRRLNSFLAVALATSLLAAGIAVWQRQTAVEAEEMARSRQLAAQSAGLIDSSPDLASLLAVQAYRTKPTEEATAAVYAAAGLPLKLRLPDVTGVAMALSPDGKNLAAVDDEQHVRIWSLSDGKARKLRLPAANLREIVFDPTGKSLAVGTGDGGIRLWDVRSDRQRGEILDSGERPVAALRFTPDGRRLLSSNTDSEITVWNLTAHRPTHRFTGYTVVRAESFHAFSPDGRTVAIGSGNGTLELWDVASGKRKESLASHGAKAIGTLEFSADGALLAVGHQDGSAALWEVTGGEWATTTLQGRDSTLVDDVTFGPDGHTLAAIYNDGTARLWDVPARKTLGVYSRVTEPAVFTPDGRSLLTGGNDGARVWGLSTVLPRLALNADTTQHAGSPPSLVFSPDSRALLARGDTVQLWAPARGRLQGELSGRVAWATAFDAHQRALAVGWSEKGRVELWDVATGRVLAAPGRHDSGYVEAVALSGDGEVLGFVEHGEDAKARLMNTRTGKDLPRVPLPDQDKGQAELALSSDGGVLAVSQGQRTRLWDTAEGKTLATVADTGKLMFSPDGRSLAIGRSEGDIRVWDTTDGSLRATLTGHTRHVTTTAFSADGMTLASSSYDGTVRLWDLSTQRSRTTFSLPGGVVTVVALSPDGRTLAAGTGDRIVRLWDVVLSAPDEAVDTICRAVARDLSAAERRNYAPESGEEPVCPQTL
ncbi:trypsin-like peptidase domain-containing protein [Streptomyces mutomycini]|uniref:Trypsin-like peptidase domain-containing protein n=2 Tax=Streptomyces TaxID=1883 RepID=A0ABW0B433_9ACTN|nr:trypsin-like peptidase domain-containing protein [Streptomyces mutomycini]